MDMQTGLSGKGCGLRRLTRCGATAVHGLLPWVAVISAGAAAVLAGAFVGRYRFIDDVQYGPALDLD